VPLVFLADLNHTTILQDPTADLAGLVLDALRVSTGPAYDAWRRKSAHISARALKARKAAAWQQFVVRAIDERGDGISDFFVGLGSIEGRRFKPLNFDLDVHPYREDGSYRSFHVNLDKLGAIRTRKLALRVIARSGTDLVGYHGFASSKTMAGARDEASKWDAVIEFDASMGSEEVSFFSPYTTTLVEIRMNREPLPLTGVNRVFWFGAGGS
jgi:hypothetical protein